MKRIKQTITALTSGDFPGGVRVSREEKEPMADKLIDMILKRIVQGIAIVRVTELIANSDPMSGYFIGLMTVLLVALYLGLNDKKRR